MKFNCGPTLGERIEAKEQWHLWFAWHPVRLGPRDCRWLEKIWRKGKYCYEIWYWQYAVTDGPDLPPTLET